MTATPLPELRAALVEGVGRTSHRRRRRRAVGGAAGTCAAAAGTLLLVLPGAGPSPALAVQAGGGVIELRIADATAGAAELTSELRGAGIDGEVRLIAVDDPLVGRWATVAEVSTRVACIPRTGAPPEVEETVRLSQVAVTPDVVRVPAQRVRSATGRFVFYAGRAPRPGETVGFDGARFAPGAGPVPEPAAGTRLQPC